MTALPALVEACDWIERVISVRMIEGIASMSPPPNTSVGARALIESFAKALSWDAASMPDRDAREGEALVWFRRAERPIALIGIERLKDNSKTAIKAEKREKSAEVGQVLRRA